MDENEKRPELKIVIPAEETAVVIDKDGQKMVLKTEGLVRLPRRRYPHMIKIPYHTGDDEKPKTRKKSGVEQVGAGRIGN